MVQPPSGTDLYGPRHKNLIGPWVSGTSQNVGTGIHAPFQALEMRKFGLRHAVKE